MARPSTITSCRTTWLGPPRASTARWPASPIRSDGAASVAFVKLDRNPYPEVLVVAQPEREDVYPSTNHFYRNVRGAFRSVPGVGLDRPVGGYCADGRDVDRDGDEDLLLCARFPVNGGTPGLRIYRNDGGQLRDRTAAMGVKPIGDRDVALADVTGDGRDDLIQLGANRVRVSKFRAGPLQEDRRVQDRQVGGPGRRRRERRRARRHLRRARGQRIAIAADRLFVNNGKGTRFTSVKIPQAGARSGRGDDVVALDYDKNGRRTSSCSTARARPTARSSCWPRSPGVDRHATSVHPAHATDRRPDRRHGAGRTRGPELARPGRRGTPGRDL